LEKFSSTKNMTKEGMGNKKSDRRCVSRWIFTKKLEIPYKYNLLAEN
jgi:hypothetical protein